VFQYALKPTPPVYVDPGPRVGSHLHGPGAHHEDTHERLAALRSFQDWNLRYALESVPGVAEVASLGGMLKQYEVQLDPDKLHATGSASRTSRARSAGQPRDRGARSRSPSTSTCCAAAPP